MVFWLTKHNYFRGSNFISGVVHAFLKSHLRILFTLKLGHCFFPRFFVSWTEQRFGLKDHLDLVNFVDNDIFILLWHEHFFSVVLGCPLFCLKPRIAFFLTSQNNKWCFRRFGHTWKLRILIPLEHPEKYYFVLFPQNRLFSSEC